MGCDNALVIKSEGHVMDTCQMAVESLRTYLDDAVEEVYQQVKGQRPEAR
jgi:hypothetical protein